MLYHNIVLKRDSKSLYDIYIKDFFRHIEILRKSGYQFINLDLLYKGGDLPYQWAILTFDDGYASHYREVCPFLLSLNIKGHFFVTTDLVGRNGFMDWLQLKEISRNHIVGSHGKTHRIFSFLSRREIVKEIELSKKIIEECIQKRIFYFSLPRGFLPPYCEPFLKDNYRFCLTSKYSAVRKIEFFLPRIWPYSQDSLSGFRRLVSLGGSYSLRWASSNLKAGLRSIFPGLYEYLRRVFLPREYQ